MTLRVGVVAGRVSATAGGWWTFTTALSLALKKVQTTHEFLFLDEILERDVGPRRKIGVSNNISRRILRRFARECVGVEEKILPQGVRRLAAKPLDRDRNGYSERLEAVVEQLKLDVVWFMMPFGVPLTIPVIATVWDLEHLKQPYFPEVSESGWSWADRERTYRALLPRASFVITGTRVGKDEIVHYYRVNPDNVRIIPHPIPGEDLRKTSIDIHALHDKFKIKGDYLFYPAQFWPHKNHVNLLMALGTRC